ncbi:uncharacterized protein LOC124410182 [Diprion similis]|uniref:uncharacterized protein LOC124410182 n=1 Tax=Diprion similis TaxID=362088 RepID=UPI001EF8FC18|nr:uncharacterized protein LOC124410182 [Diprion similis]
MHLRAGAKDWSQARVSELRTWEDFREAFKETFMTRDDVSTRWTRMTARRQDRGEPIARYFHAKVKLCSSLGLTFREEKFEVLSGLWSRELCKVVMPAPQYTLDGLLYDLLYYDKCLKSQKVEPSHNYSNNSNRETTLGKGRPSTSTTHNNEGNKSRDGKVKSDSRGKSVTSEQQNGERTCFNCKKPGHLIRDCPEELRIPPCYKCHQKGHISRNCTSEGSVDKRSEINRESTTRLYRCEVFKNSEGGAECTIRATRVLQEQFPMLPARTELKAFGPPEFVVTSVGVISAGVVIDDVELEDVTLRIVPDDAKSMDVLMFPTQCEPPASMLASAENEYAVAEKQLLVRGEVSSVPMVEQKSTSEEEFLCDTVNVGEDQPPAVRQDLIRLLIEFRDCVSTSLYDLGCAKDAVMDIKVPEDATPVQCIVTETQSAYAGLVLLVRKKTGESRLFVDFRRLNAITERVHFPLPNIDDHLAQIRDSSLFVVSDLAHGYLQLPIARSARHKTAIITPEETVEYTRMVFGLMNGPAYFSKAMHKALGLLRDNVALFYLDDILIPGNSWDDLKPKLRLVLEALRKAGLTIKLAKCCFLFSRVSYLGHEISARGIESGQHKVAAIGEFPRPKNVHEITEPISRLLRANEPFIWSESQQTAFEELIRKLTESPILQTFNPRAETELHTDASALGSAGMLMQKDKKSKLRLVLVEERASQNVIIIAVNLNSNIPFTVITDCQALCYLITQKTLNP